MVRGRGTPRLQAGCNLGGFRGYTLKGLVIISLQFLER